MIESGFNPTATSHAEAVGVWQFIPSTGKQYGLIINDVIDERRDPIRSTQAAIAYLSKLNKESGGNWHLAMASYNAGEARIYKAISEKGTINYWDLRETLAEETQYYVPKILALAIFDKYPNCLDPSHLQKRQTPCLETCHRTKESTCHNHRRHGRNGRGAVSRVQSANLKRKTHR